MPLSLELGTAAIFSEHNYVIWQWKVLWQLTYMDPDGTLKGKRRTQVVSPHLSLHSSP